MPGLCGLALAGGTARRMGGGDKPLLEIGGRPMLAYVLEALSAEAGSVAVSANGDPARFALFGVPVLNDGAFAGRGPLAGVLAGLDWAASMGGSSLLTIPGDTPFAPHGLAHALEPPPAYATSGRRGHYLVALWPVVVREELRRLLTTAHSARAGDFAAIIGMRAVAFPSDARDPFMNVNTAEDLVAARSGRTAATGEA